MTGRRSFVDWQINDQSSLSYPKANDGIQPEAGPKAPTSALQRLMPFGRRSWRHLVGL
jgi:hypothetical protein